MFESLIPRGKMGRPEEIAWTEEISWTEISWTKFRGQTELPLSQKFSRQAFLKVSGPECVGEMIICVHEPQHTAHDPLFRHNI
jgi:hypothetical protein